MSWVELALRFKIRVKFGSGWSGSFDCANLKHKSAHENKRANKIGFFFRINFNPLHCMGDWLDLAFKILLISLTLQQVHWPPFLNSVKCSYSSVAIVSMIQLNERHKTQKFSKTRLMILARASFCISYAL